MSLVHARYPGLPSGPGEEMQFDITCLDSLALRQLMDLTQACARAAKVSKAAVGCFCMKSPLCGSPALSFFRSCNAAAALLDIPVVKHAECNGVAGLEPHLCGMSCALLSLHKTAESDGFCSDCIHCILHMNR